MILQDYKDKLLDKGINPASTVEYEINEEIHTLTFQWIIEAFLKTEKKEFFLELFETVLKQKDDNISQFFQQMGQLILMSSLSENEVK